MYIDVIVARQDAFETSKAFLVEAYNYCFNLKMPELKYCAKGKPYIDGEIHFNLSHSGAYITCVFDTTEIGIDLQKMRHVPTGVMKRYLHSEIEEPTKQVLEWTKYESYGKMLGSGIPLDKSSDYNTGLYAHSFEIADYVLTVCSENRQYQDIRLVWI